MFCTCTQVLRRSLIRQNKWKHLCDSTMTCRAVGNEKKRQVYYGQWLQQRTTYMQHNQKSKPPSALPEKQLNLLPDFTGSSANICRGRAGKVTCTRTEVTYRLTLECFSIYTHFMMLPCVKEAEKVRGLKDLS